MSDELRTITDTVADALRPNCEVCLGGGWVCEEHPMRPWDSGTSADCDCSAGMPCVCTGMAGPLPDPEPSG